jgi:carboxyl-terminal processing protease
MKLLPLNHRFSKLIIGCAVVSFAFIVASADTRSPKTDITRSIDIFTSVFKELQTNYVDSIDAEKSINTAIAAMVDDIDPYTEYFPASEQDDLAMMTSGEYGGIGAVITEIPGRGVYISEPYEGTPSQKAGLKAGDQIMAIDTDTVLTWHNSEVSKRLKGEAGTPLTVTVKRPYNGADSILKFDLVRSKIQMPSVPYYGMLDGGIGYIYLTQFTDKAADDVRNALLDLKKNPEMKSLIIDLRGNPGGLLEAAVKIVGYFVPKNTEVIRTRGKGLLNEKVYKTTFAPIDTKLPLVVLIDGSSASAAEITSGSLQDMDRAVVIGSRSFGKGLVQSTRPIPYDGVLKVTTGKYYLPSGRLIQAIDYSHRNPDGSVARTPDSLTNEFTTEHGRIVRDGGGITPDIKIEYPEVNRLTYNIVSDHWAFDFATKYVAEHPTIPAPEKFDITDSIFSEFKAFIDPNKFQYDKVCEQMVKNLRKAAETEGYMTDSTRQQLDILEGLLRHDLGHDLDNNRRGIEDILAPEIVKRYYYQRGQVAQSLRHDNAIDSARTVLNSPVRYKEILAPKSKQDKKTSK